MQATAGIARKPDVVIPRLVRFYGIVDGVDALTASERSRMRKSIESRLVRQLQVLVRESKHEQSAKHSIRTQSLTLAGGGPSNPAPLIEIIVSTIAPETWQTQGGKGSISYYPQSPALVVRQSQRVHEEIADLLRALR